MRVGISRPLIIAMTALIVSTTASESRADETHTLDLLSKYPEVSQTTSGGPLWKVDVGAYAFFALPMGGGHLLVAGDSIGCAVLDPQSGTEIWSRPGLKGSWGIYWIVIPDTARGCIAYNLPKRLEGKTKSREEYEDLTIEMISLIDGFPVWSSDQLGLTDIRHASYLSSVNALWLYGVNLEHDWWSAVVSLDGKVLWQKAGLVKYDEGDVLFGIPPDTLNQDRSSEGIDSSTAMMLVLTKSAIRKVSLLTGDVIWSVSPKGWKVPDLDKRYAGIAFDGNRRTAFIPQKNSVLAIDCETGALSWAAMPPLKGHPYQMEIVDQGLLILGGADPQKEGDHDFMTLRNPADGKPVWSKDFAKLDHQFTSNFVIYRQHAWIYSKKKFWCVDLTDGSSQQLIDSLKFASNEPTPAIEFSDSAFLMTGLNTVACIEKNGTLRFLTRYNPPPAHWSIGDIFSAALVAASVASAVGSPGYHTIYVPNQLPRAGNPNATSLENRFAYILTNVRDSTDRKPGLVKVNRLTGKVEAAIQLDDRTPEYISDEGYRRLYYLRDGHTLECYEF